MTFDEDASVRAWTLEGAGDSALESRRRPGLLSAHPQQRKQIRAQPKVAPADGLNVDVIIPSNRAWLTNFELLYAVVKAVFDHLRIEASVAVIEGCMEELHVQLIGPPVIGQARTRARAYLVTVRQRTLVAFQQFATEAARIKAAGVPALHGGKLRDRFIYVIREAFKQLGPKFRACIDELLTPKNLVIMAAFVAAFALAEGTPFGLVLTGVGVVLLGADAAQAPTEFKDFIFFTGFPNPQHPQADYRHAADSLAKCIARVGLDAVLAILT